MSMMDRFINLLGRVVLVTLVACVSSAIGQGFNQPAGGCSTTCTMTSLALNGATIGTNKLAVTGTSSFSGFIAPADSGGVDIVSIGPTSTSGVGFFNNEVYFRAWDFRSFAVSNAYLGIAGSTCLTWNDSGAFQHAPDLLLCRSDVASLRLGDADAASPVAQKLLAQGSRAGTDSNVGGGNITISAGNGTGTGTPSSLLLQSPVAVASGTDAQTQTTGLTIKGGQAILAGYAVASLPTGITGGSVYVTDQLTSCPVLGGTFTGGGSVKCRAFFDGSAWTHQ